MLCCCTGSRASLYIGRAAGHSGGGGESSRIIATRPLFIFFPNFIYYSAAYKKKRKENIDGKKLIYSSPLSLSLELQLQIEREAEEGPHSKAGGREGGLALTVGSRQGSEL